MRGLPLVLLFPAPHTPAANVAAQRTVSLPTRHARHTTLQGTPRATSSAAKSPEPRLRGQAHGARGDQLSAPALPRPPQLRHTTVARSLQRLCRRAQGLHPLPLPRTPPVTTRRSEVAIGVRLTPRPRVRQPLLDVRIVGPASCRSGSARAPQLSSPPSQGTRTLQPGARASHHPLPPRPSRHAHFQPSSLLILAGSAHTSA
jgi:hypothetical protein